MWDSSATNSCDYCQCSERSKTSEDLIFDKENQSPVKNEDISLYDSQISPERHCSPNHCNHRRNLIIRRPSDHDANSRDSGYGNYTEAGRLSFESASIESTEDDFFQFFTGVEPLENNLPEDFSNLVNGPINFQNRNTENSTVTTTSPRDLVIRPLFRRALSLQNDTSPNSSRVRSCLFRENTDIRSFKRPEPPQPYEKSPNIRKKIKIIDEDEIPAVPEIQRPPLKRHFSTTEANIKWAIQRSLTEPDLIGDFSKSFSLPLIQGRHQDLKSISAETLAQLITGELDGCIASYKVIDCRYPYEYDGGHIEGAINLYTNEQCMNFLLNSQSNTNNENDKKANILVFHCEFSSERGPKLYRYLRKQDRLINQEAYPSLHYPEVYLLEGGYKKFFECHSNLCVPKAYKEMLDPKHKNDLRYFRSKSKTWNVDSRQRPSLNVRKENK